MKDTEIPEAVALVGDEIYFSSFYFKDKEIPKPKELHFIGKYSFRCKNKEFLPTGPIVLDLSSNVAPLQNVKNVLIALGFVVMDLPQAKKLIKKHFSYPREDAEEEIVEKQSA